MPTVTCPHCAKGYDVPADKAGKRFRCSNGSCNEKPTVPANSATLEPPKPIQVEFPPEVMRIIRFHNLTLGFLWFTCIAAFIYGLYLAFGPIRPGP